MSELSITDSTRVSQCLEVIRLRRTKNISLEKACEEAGITTRIFRYWMRKDENLKIAQESMQEIALESLMNVVDAYPKAIDRLIFLATNNEVPAREQLNAISKIISLVSGSLSRRDGMPIPPGVNAGYSPFASGEARGNGNDEDGEGETAIAQFDPGFNGDVDIKLSIRPTRILEGEVINQPAPQMAEHLPPQ